jgi:peptide chain release factor 3
LTEGEKIKFSGIPDFAPEFFARVTLLNPLKSKQLGKGLLQLSEEGATQLFSALSSALPVIGVVGELQFDVLKHRLEHEYGAEVQLDKIPVFCARWISGEQKRQDEFAKEYKGDCLQDKHGNLVCLFPNEYRLNLAVKNYSELGFSKVSD